MVAQRASKTAYDRDGWAYASPTTIVTSDGSSGLCHGPQTLGRAAVHALRGRRPGMICLVNLRGFNGGTHYLAGIDRKAEVTRREREPGRELYQ
jgi:hypothetical protein